MSLRLLATSVLALVGTHATTLKRQAEACQYSAPFAGIGASVCAGSDGNEHSDVLACPLQPGAVGIICPTTLRNGDTSNCASIDTPAAQEICYTENSNQRGGKEDIIHQCTCINGNFCCDQNAEVAGGEHPVDYFNDVGCNCDG